MLHTLHTLYMCLCRGSETESAEEAVELVALGDISVVLPRVTLVTRLELTEILTYACGEGSRDAPTPHADGGEARWDDPNACEGALDGLAEGVGLNWVCR